MDQPHHCVACQPRQGVHETIVVGAVDLHQKQVGHHHDQQAHGSGQRRIFHRTGQEPLVGAKGNGKDRQPLQHAFCQYAAGEDFFLRRARRPLHDVFFGWQALQHDRACGVDQQLQQHDVGRQQQQGHRRNAQKGPQQGRQGDGNVDDKNVANGLADVVVQPPSIADGFHDGGEVVIHQDQVGRLAGHFAAALAHGDANIGVFERGGVVDAIASHGHHGAIFPERLDDPHFVLGHHARKNRYGFDLLPQLRVTHAVEHFARDEGAIVGQPHFLGDGGCGDAVISGDHHDANARRPAPLDVPFHVFARRIGQPHQSQQCERTIGQFFWNLPARGIAGRGNGDDAQPARRHCNHFLLGVFPLGFGQVAKRKNAFGAALGGKHNARWPLPDLPHHFQLRAERVFDQQFATEQVLGRKPMGRSIRQHRLFHGVVGEGFTGQPHGFNHVPAVAAVRPDIVHGHLVEGDGSGLVGA